MNNINELIKIQCIRSGNLSLTQLAKRCGWAQPNLYSRMKNNSWQMKDLPKIAAALNCTLYIAFKYKDRITTADTISEMIRIQCVISDDITQTELAKRCGWSRASLSQRMVKNRWKLTDLEKVAAALNTELIIEFRPILK